MIISQGSRSAIDRATRLVLVIVALAVVQLGLAVATLLIGDLATTWSVPGWLAILSLVMVPLMILLTLSLWTSHSRIRKVLLKQDEGAVAMLSAIDQWAWGIDRQARFIYSNSSIMELAGYEPWELIGRDGVSLLVDEGLVDDARKTLDGYRQGRLGWSGWTLNLRHKNGAIRHVVSCGIPILDAQGELIGWQGSVVDKSEEVKAIAELTKRTKEVRGLIDTDALEIVFQPIVDLTDGTVVGAEALSRFHVHPYRPPNVWFAAAQEVDFGAELELHSLLKALSYMKELPSSVYMAVNVSPRLLLHAAFEGHLLKHDLSRLVIEVTEHVSVGADQYPRIQQAMRALKALGTRVAVDDAGAGFSSLRHVLELGPDIVKLDTSIVRTIETDPARRALASCLALFAKDTDTIVVAEGIETAEQARLLMSAGIVYGQGFALGRPAQLPLATRSLLAKKPLLIGR